MKTSTFAQLLEHRSVALFIGQDFPSQITGLPSRSELANDLSRRNNLPGNFTLPEVTERVSRSGNRWEFTEFLRSALDTTGKTPSTFYQNIGKEIKRHGIRKVISTCYDNSLEIALRQTGMPFDLVVSENDVHFLQSDRTTLLKLYGDIQRPDTLVVTERDHSALLREAGKKPLIEEFRQILRNYAILIIGYDLSDPDFRFVYDEIAASKFSRVGYVVWPGLPASDIQMWNDRGIVVLEDDPLGVVSNPELSVGVANEKKVVLERTSRKPFSAKDAERSNSASEPAVAVPDETPKTDWHIAEIDLHQHYSGVFGAKVLWLAVFTLLPILISMKLPRVGIHICPAALIYIIYHALGIYIWAKVRQMKIIEEAPSLKAETVRLCVKLNRMVSVLSWIVIVLLTVSFLCKLQIEFQGTHMLPFPNWVKEFVGVKNDAF